MSDLYLILHKVRGEPAFDIAQRLSIGDEEGWIIPTSGHRAYPSEWWNLENLSYAFVNPSVPDDLPDHYTIRKEATATLKGLIERLGITRKPLTRRPL